MENWKSRFAWVIGGAYLIGLIVRRGFEALWGISPLVNAPVLDVEYLIFGGVCMLASFGMYLIALRAWTIGARKRAQESWDRHHATNDSRVFKSISIAYWTVAELATQLVLYYVAVSVFAKAITGGGNRQLWIQTFLFGVPCFWPLLSYLERRRSPAAAKPDEFDLSGHTAVLAGVQGEDLSSFNIMFGVLGTAFLFGAMAYPYTVQSLGGGRPFSAWVRFQQGGDAMTVSRLRFLEQRVLFVQSTSNDFVGLMPGPDCRDQLIYVPRSLLLAVQPRSSAPVSGTGSCTWERQSTEKIQ